MKTEEERLSWLEANQPRNAVAINALRAKLGKKEIEKEPKELGFRITPYYHWQNRGRSSN